MDVNLSNDHKQVVKTSRVPPEPAVEQLQLVQVLQALADPVRLGIVRALAHAAEGKPCGQCACPKIPKSTLAHHFKVLREAGIISSKQNGTQLNNTLRSADLQRRFPGLISAVLGASANDQAQVAS